MNIELVYLILLGVNHFMENLDLDEEKQSSRTNSVNSSQIKGIRNKLTSKIKINKTAKETKMTFNKVKYKNADLWNVRNEYLESNINESVSQIPEILQSSKTTVREHTVPLSRSESAGESFFNQRINRSSEKNEIGGREKSKIFDDPNYKSATMKMENYRFMASSNG